MDINLELFGALRDLEHGDRLRLFVPGDRVADLRTVLTDYARMNWSQISPGLLNRCAFATANAVLRDNELLPVDGHMVVLPPVSGG